MASVGSHNHLPESDASQLTYIYTSISNGLFSHRNLDSTRIRFGWYSYELWTYISIGPYLLLDYSIADDFGFCNRQISKSLQKYFVQNAEIRHFVHFPLYKRFDLCYTEKVVGYPNAKTLDTVCSIKGFSFYPKASAAYTARKISLLIFSLP